MMFKCMFESRIVMSSPCETVSFVNASPLDAVDVFESYAVFRLFNPCSVCTGNGS